MRVYLSLLMLLMIIPIFSQEREKPDIDTFRVDIEALPRKINTAYSEYNGILLKDSLFFFTSIRSENMEDHENIFEKYWRMKIYYTTLTKRGYGKVETLPDIINYKKYFNANFCFNTNRDHLYIARCKPHIESELKCELWESSWKKNSWSKPEKLNEKINTPGYHTTQPYIVEYTNYSVLYFSSNRPNGFGGMDLWYAIYKNGVYEEPINLGSIINTPDNEITPFYDIRNQTLYFSSDHSPNLGGQDIYKSEGALSSWATPQNLGEPINSPYNDYYFTHNNFDHPQSGYFCSNRPQKKSRLEDTCCYDIFSWRRIPQTTDSAQEDKTIDTLSILEKMKSELPLTLYFHNDIPNPRSMDTVTIEEYTALHKEYILLKDNYKKEYSKGLKGEEKEEAEEKIECFFRDSVERGVDRLDLFTSYLMQELKNGTNLTITISGYASSLHKKEYNRRLALRRISSLINYLKEYQNGDLLPYLHGEKENRLTIISDPKGDIEAIRKNVSNNVRDKRNSIYSVEASSERRIQITDLVRK